MYFAFIVRGYLKPYILPLAPSLYRVTQTEFLAIHIGLTFNKILTLPRPKLYILGHLTNHKSLQISNTNNTHPLSLF
jgi:hypothetical protein